MNLCIVLRLIPQKFRQILIGPLHASRRAGHWPLYRADCQPRIPGNLASVICIRIKRKALQLLISLRSYQVAVLDIDPRMQRTGSGEGVSPKSAAATHPDLPTAAASVHEGATEGLADASGASEDVVMSEADRSSELGQGQEGGADGGGADDVTGAPAAGESTPVTVPAPVAAPVALPEPALDFAAFQFAAPSSTTRIGALRV